MPTALIASVLVGLGLAVSSAMLGAVRVAADEPVVSEDTVEQDGAKQRKKKTRPKGSSHGSYSGE